MTQKYRYAVIGVILLGAALRSQSLFFGVFQVDEALFSSWSRLIAVWRDPLLITQAVDKPPLFFYLQALFFPLFGADDWAARLPNYLLSIMIIPLATVITWRLYGDRLTAFIAALIAAMSPLIIRYSATAFLDPMMIAWILLAIAIVVSNSSKKDTSNNCLETAEHEPQDRGFFARFTRVFQLIDRPYITGFIFGLALATKYQAILFLPLIIGLALIFGWRRRHFIQGLTAFMPIIAVVLAWDLIQDDQLNLISNQWASIGGLRLSWSWELWSRARGWLQVWYSVINAPLLILVTIVVLPLLASKYIFDRDRQSWIDFLFAAYLFSVGLFHWLVAIPVWGRYAYVVAPILVILFARIVVQLWNYATGILYHINTVSAHQISLSGVLPLILFGVLILSSISASRGELELSDPAQPDSNFGVIAAFFENVPAGSVLYDHWYSWYWRYYILDKEIYLSWFLNPQSLVEDLEVFGYDGTSRFLALPSGQIANPVTRAVKKAGFSLYQMTPSNTDAVSEILIFRIVPPQQGYRFKKALSSLK